MVFVAIGSGILISHVVLAGGSFVKIEFSKIVDETENLIGRKNKAEVIEAVAYTPPEDKTAGVYLGNITDEDFIPPEEGKIIRINLETMKLFAYEDGEVVKEIEVLRKGKPGSYWETPGGEFSIKTKEENHLSSVGRAWMPYSMQFFGNFFIHGWPSYENGIPYPKTSQYSGGCIRLSTEDAKDLYEWSDIGTKVSIYSESEIGKIAQGESYFLLDKNKKPNIDSESYIVGDLESGEILLAKNMLEVRPIASVTKLMTALTELEVVSQRRDVTITKDMLSAEGQNGGFSVGEKIPTSDLIYPLLLVSSNDAAEILARFVGRNHFIEQMNKKAQSIGLEYTTFYDPSGLSEFNTSTAYDLLKLARYIYFYKPYVLETTVEKDYETENHYWKNTSQFLGQEGYMGGKRGYTSLAKETNLGIFEINVNEFTKRPIGIIVLGSNDRKEDTLDLIKYIEENIYLGLE